MMLSCWYRGAITAVLVLTAGRAVAQGAPTVQAARDIARDEVLSRTDFAGDSAASDALVGWVARRRIRAGEPLRPPAIGPLPIVAAGADVTVMAVVDGAQVNRRGVALGGGARGQRIRVRLENARIVVASVTGPSEVQLP